MTKQQARVCTARYLNEEDGERCVLPPGAHDMARDNRGRLGLPVLIHQQPDGRLWTVRGPFVREQRQEV